MSIKSLTLLTASLFLLLAAVLQNVGQLYFMAGIIMAIALVARLAVLTSLQGLAVKRTVIDRVYEGQPVGVQLTLTNTSRLPKFFLAIEEDLSPWLESESHRFLIPALWPGKSVELEYECIPTKRGRLQVGPLFVSAADPIGVLSRNMSLPEAASALVYPRPLEVAAEDLAGGAYFGHSVADRVARTGEGLDFVGVRDYKQGDELRRIHWKAVARHQQLTVIEFQQAQSADVAVALDLLRGTEVGEGKETTLEYGVKIAATLGQKALDNGARVTYGVHDIGGLKTLTCSRNEDFLGALELLAEAEANGPVAVTSVMERLRPLLSPGTAAILITSDSDPRLVDVARLLEGFNISLGVVLIDASSFLQHPAEEAGAGVEGGEQSPARKAAPAVKSYDILAENLRRAGVSAHIVRRGDDLAAAVRKVMHGAQ